MMSAATAYRLTAAGGSLLLAIGAGLVYLPAGVIVLGLLLILAGVGGAGARS